MFISFQPDSRDEADPRKRNGAPKAPFQTADKVLAIGGDF